MGDDEKSKDVPMVCCDVCMKEIPGSEARSEEARDYVVHFCGLECYEKWKQKAAEQDAG